jgi:hypothetical protein
VVVHAYNSSTREAEAGELGHTGRPCFKTNEKQTKSTKTHKKHLKEARTVPYEYLEEEGQLVHRPYPAP